MVDLHNIEENGKFCSLSPFRLNRSVSLIKLDSVQLGGIATRLSLLTLFSTLNDKLVRKRHEKFIEFQLTKTQIKCEFWHLNAFLSAFNPLRI